MSDISMAEAGLPVLGKEPAVARSRLALALIELALAVGPTSPGSSGSRPPRRDMPSAPMRWGW